MPKGSRGGHGGGGGSGGVAPQTIPAGRGVSASSVGSFNLGGGVPQRGQRTRGHDLIADYSSGFDDNGNPEVQKWQAQVDDKAASFLSKVDRDYTYRNGKYYDANGNEISDKYGFYDGEYQKFSMAVGLNGKPQVMDDKAFDAMVSQNNLQVVYRGESGQNAADRFFNADIAHAGVGNFGDGYYFSTDKSDAIGYAQMKSGYNGTGKVETMVLSPTARAIKLSDLRTQMNNFSPKLRRALQIAGNRNTSGYSNEGYAQAALKLGYNVIAIDRGYNTYCVAIDRSAFIVRKTVESY